MLYFINQKKAAILFGELSSRLVIIILSVPTAAESFSISHYFEDFCPPPPPPPHRHHVGQSKGCFFLMVVMILSLYFFINIFSAFPCFSQLFLCKDVHPHGVTYTSTNAHIYKRVDQ